MHKLSGSISLRILISSVFKAHTAFQKYFTFIELYLKVMSVNLCIFLYILYILYPIYTYIYTIAKN